MLGRDSMKSWIEDKSEMEKILQTQPVGCLGVVDGDEPYVIPLNFGYKDGRIYFHTGLEGRKIEVIAKNPRVCFEVHDAMEIIPNEQVCFFTAHYRSVIAWGTAKALDNDADKLEALKVIVDKYSEGKQYEPIPEPGLALVTVYEIAVDKMTGKSNLPDE